MIEPAAADAGDAPLASTHHEEEAELVGCVQSELLPFPQGGGGVVVRPDDAEGDHAIDGVNLEGELGYDSEVSSAATPQRPIEIGVHGRARGQWRAAGVHHLRGEKVVGGEPKLARRDAVATAQSESGDADRFARSRRERQFFHEQLFRDISEQTAGADARGLVGHVDHHRVHLPDVDHDAGAGRESLVGMAAAVTAERESMLPRPLQRQRYALRGAALRDHSGPHARAQIEWQKAVELRIAGPQRPCRRREE